MVRRNNNVVDKWCRSLAVYVVSQKVKAFAAYHPVLLALFLRTRDARRKIKSLDAIQRRKRFCFRFLVRDGSEFGDKDHLRNAVSEDFPKFRQKPKRDFEHGAFQASFDIGEIAHCYLECLVVV